MMPEPVKIDIIILSYAKNESLKTLTRQTIQTLFESENPEEIEFNVLVIESNRELEPFQYEGTTTIYPQLKFGYNRFMNIGIKTTSNPYVCMCNNDLIFHRAWATELLKELARNKKILSANSFAGAAYYSENIVKGENVMLRSKNPKETGILRGWCIFVKREIFDIIGLLDEQFEFWYADTDYDFTLRKHKVEHALVKTSVVEHIAMQSHDLLADKEKFTYGQKEKFDQKWGRKSFFEKTTFKIKESLKKNIRRFK